MKKWKRRLRRDIILAAMAVTWLCSSTHVLAEETETTKTDQNVSMLFISSYSYTWPTVPLQLEGIQSALDDTVTLDVEFMDTKTIRWEMAEKGLLERIRFKEENVGLYDAVIVGDDGRKYPGRKCCRRRQFVCGGHSISFL